MKSNASHFGTLLADPTARRRLQRLKAPAHILLLKASVLVPFRNRVFYTSLLLSAGFYVSAPAPSLGQPISTARSFCSGVSARLKQWKATDWSRLTTAVKQMRVPPQRYRLSTSDPLILRDFDRLREFGVPITEEGPGAYSLHFDQIDFAKLARAAQNAKIPFHPSLPLEIISSGKIEWIRLGIDPLPKTPFKVIDQSVMPHDEWGKLMSEGKFPISIDVIWHDLAHLLVYRDDPNYAQAVMRYYQGKSPSVPLEAIIRWEEAGAALFHGTADEIASWLATWSPKRIESEPATFERELAEHVRVYGAVMRQANVIKPNAFGLGSFDEALISWIAKPEKPLIDFADFASLHEIHQSIRLIEALKENPLSTLSKLDVSSWYDPHEKEVVIELYQQKPEVFRQQLSRALAALRKQLERLSNDKGVYTTAPVRDFTPLNQP